MKAFAITILAAAMLALPSQRARAFVIHEIIPPPMPQPPVPVGLGLALKCIFIAVTAATGYIVHRCGAEYWLCITTVEMGEDPEWFVSQGTVGTLAKTGARRCRGPFRDRGDADLMAKVNNANAATNRVPVFLCIPTVPPPTSSPVPVRMTLEQSQDGGTTWVAIATVDTDADETCPFGLLPATGTNGMSRAQLLEYAGCTLLVTNRAGDSAWHRVLYESP